MAAAGKIIKFSASVFTFADRVEEIERLSEKELTDNHVGGKGRRNTSRQGGGSRQCTGAAP